MSLEDDEVLGFDARMAKVFKKLWQKEEIKMVYKGFKYAYPRFSQYVLLHLLMISFMNSMDRLLDYRYVPSHEDIVLCNSPTIVSASSLLTIDDVNFKITDVGGSRTVRHTWFDNFNVDLIVFCVNISGYDDIIIDDGESINELEEAYDIWSELVKSKAFQQKKAIILFTKCDILKDKIENGEYPESIISESMIEDDGINAKNC